uniref:Protein kinase domain-containing protein n=1 Tax=Lactuca sativa TaxID=4236 RepID=A0A9R1X2L0_LACSA|nr:hypothetical protein LSAT_V11C700381190 [Lactuca sativa]
MVVDFKPENVFFSSIDEDSPLKATEFVLSVFFKPDVLSDIVGRVYNVAPEFLRRHYGAEPDIWSTGVILYILLSGVQLSNFIFSANLQKDMVGITLDTTFLQICSCYHLCF